MFNLSYSTIGVFAILFFVVFLVIYMFNLSFSTIGVLAIIFFVVFLAYLLTRTKEQFTALTDNRFITTLDYLAKFGIVGSVIVFVYGLFTWDGHYENQKVIRIREAWQLLNSSERLEGTRGRKEALEELNDLEADLQFINLEESVLNGIELKNSKMMSVKFNGTRIQFADFTDSDLDSAEFQCADLCKTDFSDSDFTGANLNFSLLIDTVLKNVDFSDAQLQYADLSNADLSGIKWNDVTSFQNAFLGNVKNPPPGFWEKVNSDGGQYMDRFKEFGSLSETIQKELYKKWNNRKCSEIFEVRFSHPCYPCERNLPKS